MFFTTIIVFSGLLWAPPGSYLMAATKALRGVKRLEREVNNSTPTNTYIKNM
jgi:hypothetical protein